MQTLESIIKAHPFFLGLDHERINFVVSCAKNVRFDEGEIIFREGEPADWFYLIRAGRVALEIHVPAHGTAILETIEQGDVLGWSWLFAPYRWHFNARALELVRALAFDGKCLRQKCEQDHHLGYELMRRTSGILMERLQATRMRLLDLYAVRA